MTPGVGFIPLTLAGIARRFSPGASSLVTAVQTRQSAARGGWGWVSPRTAVSRSLPSAAGSTMRCRSQSV